VRVAETHISSTRVVFQARRGASILSEEQSRLGEKVPLKRELVENS